MKLGDPPIYMKSQQLNFTTKLFTFYILKWRKRKGDEVRGLSYFWPPCTEIQPCMYCEQFVAQNPRVNANEGVYMVGSKELRVGSLLC